MDVTQRMAAVAAAMASPSRLRMLESLGGGIARSAIDLAAIADIQPNTATTHLQSLSKAGLVKVVQQGRYRYFRIKDETVGDLIEVLGEQSGKEESKANPSKSDMAYGRTCYDHLAGWIGVQLTNSLVTQGHIKTSGKSFELTKKGDMFLTGLGVDLTKAHQTRRVFARACQDWTEGEAHLGGALGAGLFQYFEEHNWLKRNPEYREVYLLPKGKKNFKGHFNIKL